MIREGGLFLEIHLVGESFNNPDGTSRQAEIAKCQPGEPVTLSPQPDNPHDPNAILCLSARGVGLGHVPKTLCGQVKDALEANFYERSRIAHIIGGVKGKPSLGVMIVLTARGSRYRVGGKVPFNPNWRGMRQYRDDQRFHDARKSGFNFGRLIAKFIKLILR